MNTKTKTTLILIATLLLGILLGVLLSGLPYKRLERPAVGMMPRERFDRVIERIVRPSGEQRAKIEEALDHRFSQLAALFEQHQSEVFTIYDSLRTDLAAVLTPEQIARFDREIVRGGYRFIEDRIERLTEELQLDRTQRRQVEEILKQLQPPPRPAPPGDWDRHRGSRQELRLKFERLNDEIERILTPEQKERFRELRKHRRKSGSRQPAHLPDRQPRDQR